MKRLHIYWDWEYESLEEEMRRRNPRGDEILNSVYERLSTKVAWPVHDLTAAQREIQKCKVMFQQEVR